MQSRCDVHSHERRQERAAESPHRPLPGVRPGLVAGFRWVRIRPRNYRPALEGIGPAALAIRRHLCFSRGRTSITRAKSERRSRCPTIRSVVHNCSVSAAAPFASPRGISASRGSPWNAARRCEAKSTFCSFSTGSRSSSASALPVAAKKVAGTTLDMARFSCPREFRGNLAGTRPGCSVIYSRRPDHWPNRRLRVGPGPARSCWAWLGASWISSSRYPVGSWATKCRVFRY
jgi:hypothetical protein